MDEEILNEDEQDTEVQQDENRQQNSINGDIIRGHINTIILRTLYDRDKYGYEIINEIETKSHGQYSLKQPTLYSALKRLESQGYIKAYWKNDEVSSGGRRKYFTLTDSGREITEKNQAEWEYSRSVIDSLISDKAFDFSSPAPTAVDFNILKSSVSKVPFSSKSDIEPEQKIEGKDEAQKETASIQPQPVAPVQNIDAEKQQQHENYLRLISTPVKKEEPEKEVKEEPTEKLYISKPETERDYKNLIDGIFNKAIKTSYSQPTKQTHIQLDQKLMQSNLEEKSYADGLKISKSTTERPNVQKNTSTYNVGTTLFKSSVIVGLILLIEFALCLVFGGEIKLSIYYPYTILIIAISQFAIFSSMGLMKYGENTPKPTNSNYISISVVLTLIAILIICLVSFLLKTNVYNATQVISNIVIPCVLVLNYPVFTICYKNLIK